ncbi:hypothetical protein D1872_229950 [compost metagenome]
MENQGHHADKNAEQSKGSGQSHERKSQHPEGDRHIEGGKHEAGYRRNRHDDYHGGGNNPRFYGCLADDQGSDDGNRGTDVFRQPNPGFP